MSRKISFSLAVLPLIIMALLLVIGYGFYHIKIQVLLLLSAFVAGVEGWLLGFSWKELQDGIVEASAKALPAMLIMLTVGVLIGSWIASGLIPVIIYYGLKTISPAYFLITAYIVCSLVSITTGTSWGTIGTIGVAFIGISRSLGIPDGIAAGAIVAGAYFGDKMSPFSDVTNLAPVIAGTDLFEHIKHMIYSAFPAWLLGAIAYFFLGSGYRGMALKEERINLILETLKKNFDFNLFLLIPMIIVFYYAITKKPTIPGMIISSLVASFNALIFQRQTIIKVAEALNTGYVSRTGLEMVDRLISRGGLMSMMETTLIAIIAFAFGGILQKTGMMKRVLEEISKFTKSVGRLVLATSFSSVFVAGITGSSYLSMIIPGELFAPLFENFRLHPKNLSRIIEEAGAIIVPLIPWSMAGVYVHATIGVSALQYAPWAFMNYLSVGFLILYGFTGFTMVKLSEGKGSS